MKNHPYYVINDGKPGYPKSTLRSGRFLPRDILAKFKNLSLVLAKNPRPGGFPMHLSLQQGAVKPVSCKKQFGTSLATS